MNDYMVAIPERLYDKARRVAEQSDQPIDEVIVTRLEQGLAALLDLPADERAEIFMTWGYSITLDDLSWAATETVAAYFVLLCCCRDLPSSMSH